MTVGRQLPRFAVAGAIGFVVDAGLLYAALLAGLDYYTGRLVSFCAAVITTWLINRSWTFGVRGTPPTVAEFARYFSAMALGGAVNYATYAVIVAAAPAAAWLPLVAVAAGSIAGLSVNFATARNWVFNPGARSSVSNSASRSPSGGMPQAVPSRRAAWPESDFWAALAGSLLALKVAGLALDPQPQFFMGDSASYVHTALTGWVPPDRSYWYGVLVRVIVRDTQSLTPLLLAQAAASAATALLAAWWSRLVFSPGRAILCAVAFLCALDPSQMLFERYVMTETFSLLLFAIMMVALTYVIVRGRWHWMALAAVAAAGVVAMRMSLLPVVAVSLALAPPMALAAGSLGWRRAVLALCVALLFLPLGLPEAGRVRSGPFLLAAWSPLLKPGDFPDPALGERILRDIDAGNPDLFAREVNLWHPSGFMRRMDEEFPDPAARNRVARKTAMRILLRDPFGILGLGWRTYARLWDAETRRRLMRWDVGQNPLGEGFRETLAKRFRIIADDIPGPTPTSRIYLSVGLWTAVASLLSPVLLLAATFGRPRRQWAALAMLIVASGLILSVTGLLTTLPVVRYLHPIGWMLAAGCLPALFAARSRRDPGRSSIAAD